MSGYNIALLVGEYFALDRLLLDYVKLYWLRFWMFLGFGTT